MLKSYRRDGAASHIAQITAAAMAVDTSSAAAKAKNICPPNGAVSAQGVIKSGLG